jgi:hypothetical protein
VCPIRCSGHGAVDPEKIGKKKKKKEKKKIRKRLATKTKKEVNL